MTTTALTIADAAARWTRTLEIRQGSGQLSAKTVRTYLDNLEEFVRLAGPDTGFADRTTDDIDEIIVAFSKLPDRRFTANPNGKTRGAGATTSFASTVSALYSWAIDRELATRNPVKGSAAKPRGDKGVSARRAGVTMATAQELLDRIPGMYAPERTGRKVRGAARLTARADFMVRLLLTVGPRRDELVNADRTDLVVRDGQAWLTLTGKGNKTRVVPVTPDAYAAWERYAALRTDDNPALFTTHYHNRINGSDVARTIDDLSDDTLTPHALRHTAATLLLRSGALAIHEVRDLLGHASIATTSLYLESHDQDLAAGVARLGTVLGGQSDEAAA